MGAEALALVLLSALIHPLRELLLKGHDYPESAYLAVVAGWVPIAAAHSALMDHAVLLDRQVAGFAVVSALCLTAYYYGTMAALKTGDLSIYYPIIRSSPLIVVAVLWSLGWRDYNIAVLGGIALVVVASFALQRQNTAAKASTRTAALALLAMAGSAGYTISDSLAMTRSAAPPFLFWIYLMVAPAFAALAITTRPAERPIRTHLTGAWRRSPLRLMAASLVSYISYALILTAFSRGAGAAETAAVRQVSIPLSVILAAVALGETRFVGRLGWASLIAAGIVLIALGG
ncbi:MAG: hypothetical protein AB7E80_04695 [Hyphomicrobiaceae bacterium]